MTAQGFTSTDRVRAPAVAASFYPSDAQELRAMVREHLTEGLARAVVPRPKALIAPHAGYVYSGPVAGSAFAALAAQRGRIARVVLMGPSHRGAFAGLAVPEASALATPLGLLPVDEAAVEALRALPQVSTSDRAHAGEHCLEVELPFLQETLGEVPVVPIVVGGASDAEAAEVLERAWGGPETCVVISSDLSHYLQYSEARRLDRATAFAIERLAPDEIDDEQACGSTGVRALLRVARAKGLKARTLDLRSSGDTEGSRDRVVGYGAFAFA